jgi:hypothetical protein
MPRAVDNMLTFLGIRAILKSEGNHQHVSERRPAVVNSRLRRPHHHKRSNPQWRLPFDSDSFAEREIGRSGWVTDQPAISSLTCVRIFAALQRGMATGSIVGVARDERAVGLLADQLR